MSIPLGPSRLSFAVISLFLLAEQAGGPPMDLRGSWPLAKNYRGKIIVGTLAPSACTIQISNESALPVTWTDVSHVTCVAAQTASAHFGPIEARFVRMIAEAGPAPGGCQLREFAVMGVEWRATITGWNCGVTMDAQDQGRKADDTLKRRCGFHVFGKGELTE